LWSVATAATCFAQGFVSLALSRTLVGIGEATVFPVGLSLLADLYPGARLARSVSIFQSSSGVGVMAGSVLAGLLAASLGWRMMFQLFGAAGSVLAFLLRSHGVHSRRSRARWSAGGDRWHRRNDPVRLARHSPDSA